MSKSIADLRKSPHAGLPRHTMSLCLSQRLVARVQQLEQEQNALRLRPEPEAPSQPRKASQPPDPRIAEITAELDGLYDEMREHTGDLTVQATSEGEWRRWVEEHPPRDDNTLDEKTALGICNADALFADTFRYAHAWNDETLTADDWTWITQNAAPGDLKAVVTRIVIMHEGEGARPLPKSRKPSPTTPPSETATN